MNTSVMPWFWLAMVILLQWHAPVFANASPQTVQLAELPPPPCDPKDCQPPQAPPPPTPPTPPDGPREF
jgi:hypothetical protein